MTKLGVTLPQFTGDVPRFVSAARRAEDLGLDSVWVFDHLWPLSGGKARPVLESWTSVAYLLAATQRITVGTLVTRSSLRNHLLLARMIETVHEIAPGRLVVGLGSGDSKSRPENEAFGLPYWEGEERRGQLRATQEGLRAHFDDKGPLPRIGTRAAPKIWLGGWAPELLELAGELGDGWNGWSGSPEAFEGGAETLQRLSGRRTVERTWGGLVSFTNDPSTEPAHSESVFRGPPAEIARVLLRFVAAGAQHLVVTFAGTWTVEALETLAREVAPEIQQSTDEL